VAQNIYDLWNKDGFTLNPSDKTPCSFENFYAKMCGELADAGSVYKTTSESLEMTRDQIESSRQGVIGVNADEELTDMIKYQNAYNASSRYINVVSAMIDTLINSMGR
jgi:flagellar hook-associated protein 1 FlgK